MAPTPPVTKRREDPIVAQVRQARTQLFAAAGYDLDELCRQLNEQQHARHDRALRPPRRPMRRRAPDAAPPNKSMRPTRGKNVSRR